MSSKKKSVLGGSLVLLTWLGTASWASAKSPPHVLKRFEDAAQATGCKAIPFVGMQTLCKNAGKKKDEECKEVKTSCKLLGTQIENKKKELADKKEQLEDLQERSPNHPDVFKLRKKISDIERSIKRFIGNIEANAAQAWSCRDARVAQQRIFAQAEKSVEKHIDEDLEDHKKKIIEHYDSEKQTHQDEIDKAKQNAESCEDGKLDALEGKEKARYQEWLGKERERRRAQ